MHRLHHMMAVASSSSPLDASRKKRKSCLSLWVASPREFLNLGRRHQSGLRQGQPFVSPPWTHKIPRWWPPAWSVRPALASPSLRSAWLPPRLMSASCLQHLRDERGLGLGLEGQFSSSRRGSWRRQRRPQTKCLVQSQKISGALPKHSFFFCLMFKLCMQQRREAVERRAFKSH